MRRLIVSLLIVITVPVGSVLAADYTDLQTSGELVCMMAENGKTVCFRPEGRGNWTVTTFDPEKKTVTKEDVQEIKYTR